MSNDFTWEQKCRISALRAACASSFDEGSEYRVTDEEMTPRILVRAEMFRVALLNDGPLDDRYHGQEALGSKSVDADRDPETEVCPACGSGIPILCKHRWHVEAAV